jgi:dipeptidyl aminopeptidase/acylaminoacyl peptidase
MRKTKRNTYFILGLTILGFCFISIILALKPLRQPLVEEESPNWAPNGQYMAMVCYLDGPTEEIADTNLSYFTAEAADICITDIDGDNTFRLTKSLGEERRPVWSPDSTRIAYIRSDGIYIVDFNGDKQRQLVHYPGVLEELDEIFWSPAGTHLLFSARSGNSNYDIYTVNLSITAQCC